MLANYKKFQSKKYNYLWVYKMDFTVNRIKIITIQIAFLPSKVIPLNTIL